MVVEVPVREVSPDSMVHAPEIWMIRPGSVRARGHELIDQCLQGGKILRPDRRWGVECLGRTLDLGPRPWEEVENKLPHDWVMLHTANGRTRIVVVWHAHLIAQVGEHCGCRQAPPERWRCRIEARQAIEEIVAVLVLLDRPHEVRHQAPPVILIGRLTDRASVAARSAAGHEHNASFKQPAPPTASAC